MTHCVISQHSAEHLPCCGSLPLVLHICAKPKFVIFTSRELGALRSSKVLSRNDPEPTDPCATPLSWQNATAESAPLAMDLCQPQRQCAVFQLMAIFRQLAINLA